MRSERLSPISRGSPQKPGLFPDSANNAESDSLNPEEGVTLLTYVIIIVLIVVVAALYMRVRSRKAKG